MDGPAVVNGLFDIPSSPTVGTSVALECDSMFEVSGPSFISCQANGKWTTGGTCVQGICIK